MTLQYKLQHTEHVLNIALCILKKRIEEMGQTQISALY